MKKRIQSKFPKAQNRLESNHAHHQNLFDSIIISYDHHYSIRLYPRPLPRFLQQNPAKNLEYLQGGCLYFAKSSSFVMIERTELFRSFIKQIKGKLVRNNMLKTRT